MSIPLNFAVVYGSVRENRQGIRAAQFVINMLQRRGHQTTLIDPAERQIPLSQKVYKSYDAGSAPKVLEDLAAIYRQSDAFVFVSAEYNHSFPAALKNLIDHFMEEYFWRPAGIATYSAGAFGGIRAGDQLRVVLAEVGLVTIPTSFPISHVSQSIDENGNALEPAYEKRIQKFLDELEWYARALKVARTGGVPY